MIQRNQQSHHKKWKLLIQQKLKIIAAKVIRELLGQTRKNTAELFMANSNSVQFPMYLSSAVILQSASVVCLQSHYSLWSHQSLYSATWDTLTILYVKPPHTVHGSSVTVRIAGRPVF